MLSRLLPLMLALLLALPAHAITVIRDAEIERSLKEIAKPVLRAAGLGTNSVRILVIQDNSLNAFVVDSRHIFVHSGLIMRLKRPEALQAVLAHEIAHIANGHLVRRAGNARTASRVAAIGLALSVAAAAKGESEAAIGIAAGSAGSAQRVFFAHTRAEEASADQSALRYMASAGIDPAAMNDILDLFRGQEALRSNRQDPYARTHPLTADRLRAVRGYVAGLKARTRPASAETVYWYNRMEAKLQGFLQNSKTVLRRPEAKGNGETAVLRRAVAYHRRPAAAKALKEMNTLLKLRPRDPYYHELRGQILLESRNTAAAVQSYRNAVNLARGEPLILAGLGKALLAANTKASNAEALRVLNTARGRDPGDPVMLRNLALAHAKNGQNAMASVATAERYLVIGRFNEAELHSKRALGALPRGSQGWLRAQDVLSTAKAAPKKRRR
ncbi:M48 family metalloprotease [uncultured Litoreibacter sp.]|uniref:M48 family metalloprotease n=1 Tax=uncultured Litoreibacter sp. TaxID=1392394 RepID=UPI0026083B40|nr:M48 family metalloprotease [uncultured Litoreibacter sp.]